MADAGGQKTKRRQAEKRGRTAEALCVGWLRVKGYRILAKRFRSHAGEIDLIARRGRLLAFIEVKARAGETAALEAITPHQQRRIVRAAESFLAKRRDLRGLDIRFDVMTVRPGKPPKHLKDAFRP